MCTSVYLNTSTCLYESLSLCWLGIFKFKLHYSQQKKVRGLKKRWPVAEVISGGRSCDPAAPQDTRGGVFSSLSWSFGRWLSSVSACTRLEKHHLKQTRHILWSNLHLLPVRWSPVPEPTSTLLWVLFIICRTVIMGLSWTCDPDLIRALEPDLEHPNGHLCAETSCSHNLYLMKQLLGA